MEFKLLNEKALELQRVYDVKNITKGEQIWTAREYCEGLVGDIGDLVKLIMAKYNLRGIENVDEKLRHELSDCLWSLLVLSNELNIDLEKEFFAEMENLKKRFQ